ncbi:NAD(P)H-binding protein [Actinomycetaceae bacterium L2_0104]
MRILILGATGRTGSALLGELPPDVDAVAALRRYDDVVRLPRSSCGLTHVVLTLEDAATLRRAVDGVDVIVNAIRLREDIAPAALIGIHLRLLNAAADREPDPLIVTVGGAGSLRLPNGTRFWQHPTFPARTLPRGIAHAHLRDYLESGQAGDRWAYLVPPPAFIPERPRHGSFSMLPPGGDETAFTTRSIGYTDFACALAASAQNETTGTWLVSERSDAD